jgi:hypothetical protein
MTNRYAFHTGHLYGQYSNRNVRIEQAKQRLNNINCLINWSSSTRSVDFINIGHVLCVETQQTTNQRTTEILY